MSHTTTIKSVKVQDISALRIAVEDLKASGVNIDLLENVKPRMYYPDQHGKCDYVVKLHDSPYDVGFQKQEDGSYVPIFDEWNGSVGKQLGATCALPQSRSDQAQHQIGRLMQGYAKQAAINAAIAQGYMVSDTEVDDDGNVHLTITI